MYKSNIFSNWIEKKEIVKKITSSYTFLELQSDYCAKMKVEYIIILRSTVGYKMTMNFGVGLDGIVFSKFFNLRFSYSIGNMETPGYPEDCVG